MNKDSFSIDDVYREGIGIPKNPVDEVYIEQETGWDEIDWEEPDVSEDVRDALAVISTQYHYISLAQMTMLGDIIGEDSRMRAKRLAALLVPSRARNVDSWGKYLEKLHTCGDFHPEIKNYLSQLSEDEQVVSQLIGTILLDILLRTMYENLDSYDSTFEQLLERDIEQAEKNIELAEKYLIYWQKQLSKQEKRDVSGRIQYYITLLEEFIDSSSTDMDTINVDSMQVLKEFNQNATKFYFRIHPPE